MAAVGGSSGEKVKIGILGAAGRVGRRLLALASESADIEIVCAIVRSGSSSEGKAVKDIEPQIISGTSWESLLCTTEVDEGNLPDVVIDFSSAEAMSRHCTGLADKGVAFVSGTTGLNEDHRIMLADCSKKAPVLWARNFSLGVNLMQRVCAEVAKALGPAFDIEITEAHHNRKADAPSGTAMAIAESICSSLGKDPKETLRHGREGRTDAKRVEGEIGMHALRMGAVVGEHTVNYASDFERIELSHRAQTRDVFASGALRAARWLG